jgi:hypothetical protein
MSTLSELVGKETIEKVLAKGRSTGAGFSEIFIEDKRSTSAGLDDEKWAEKAALYRSARNAG